MKGGPRNYIFVGVASAGLLVLLSLLCTNSQLRVLSLFFITVMTMAGLYVTTSLAGVVSLCHAAFAGVGAYASAIVAMRLGLWPIASTACGIVSAGAVALVLAWATRRLESHYLSLATLAASEILSNIFRSASALTGGANGLPGVPHLSLGGISLDSPARYYPYCVATGALALGFVALLERSRVGIALRAAENEGVLVECLGIGVPLLRIIGFVVGASLAGLAGAVSAHIDGFVGPESFGVGPSICYLCFLLIGGLRRIRCVPIAAALATLGVESLRGFVEWQMILVSVLILVLLYLQRNRAA